MNVRRSAAVLAATAVIGAAAPAVAASPSPSPSVVTPDGLYGSADPTYDGVWRQSVTLLAQVEQGVDPAEKAVDWLAGQQCANGAFPAFRADAAKACDAKVMVDTNSTAAAVQALAATGGHQDAPGKAVAWLKSVQNKDGGWGYMPGGASDANSTSVVIGALTAVGEQPAKVRTGGRTPYDALLKLALPCTGDGAGAFAYQPDKKGKLAANADATAAAVLGALGEQPTNIQADDDTASASCAKPGDAEQAAHNGASYLARTMAKDKHLTSVLPGSENQPDYGNTADAVVALSAADFHTEATASGRWLAAHALKWAEQSGPAAYAQLVLAAQAAGLNPRDFGGADLVALLNATGPQPRDVPAANESRAPEADDKAAEKDEGGVSVWWIIGVGLVAGIGVGFLISGRNKKRQP
ncbi:MULTISPECIES: prenyltransferase/squalene oxidase repeat-containing protein [unclassified Streptomyces]|uniref:prenyltransferase/squalene oxidase repeat-containing protein n=1 Tax=unclassified Streptomyces TaxID=2593676 RepID=UPI0036E73778